MRPPEPRPSVTPFKRFVRLLAQTSLVASLLSSCTGEPEDISGQDTLQVPLTVQKTGDDSVTIKFSYEGDSLAGLQGEDGLEPACLAALEYQNRFERAYLKGKIALLEMIRDRGSDGLFKDSKTTTQLPVTLLVTVGGRAIDFQTERDSSTTTEGGSVTAGGGSGGSGGAISVAAPQQTVSKDNTDNVTLEFSTSASLSIPLSNQVQFTEIPADESTLMTEAIRAFYKLPIFCNVMKKCTGFGIPTENFQKGSFCGGSSFPMGGGGGAPP